MKLSKILLSTSVVLPLVTIPTVVSCSEKGEIQADLQRKYSVSNIDPVVSIPFHWTGDKTKTINATIVEKGSYNIEIDGAITIQNDGNFNLNVMFENDFIAQTSEEFDVTFTYLLNDKEASQTFTSFQLVYEYQQITDDRPIDFIYNRSISLMGYGESKSRPGYASLCWGTAWILSDATKNVYDDYQYYVATNWHVKYGIDQVNESVVPGTFCVCYGHAKHSLEVSDKDYHVLDEYTPEEESKFTYSGSTEAAIDFYIAKVNFGSRPANCIRPYLNYLNGLQQEKGYITKTVQTDSTHKYSSLVTYMGGYPVRNEYYATWGFQTITADYLEYIDYDDPDLYHYVDEEETIKDVSPLYTFKDEYTVDPEWMPGGASGSMLIAKIEDEWQVIGIYWGGFNDYYGFYFWPAFSIFNSNYKDFSSGY